MDIIDLAHRALSVARREGATQAEAFAVTSVTKSVYVDDDRIKIVEEKGDQGLAVRVLKGRKLAQASSACTNVEDAEGCARAASMLADRSPASRTYDRFPQPTRAGLSPAARDDRIASLEVDELVELVRSTVGAVTDRGAKVPRGVMRAAATTATVINTNGLEVSNHGTLVFAGYDAMASGPSPGEGVGSFNSPWLKDYDPQRMGENIARQALQAREAKSLEGPFKAPVMISPGELGEMLSYSVAFALSAESVNKRRSPWGSMQDKSVASSKVTLADDPADPRGALSAAYDDEGVPTSVKKVVENGVLKTFLYDSYNSSVAQKPPSGNGMRRGPIDAQFQFLGSPGCRAVNLVLKPGLRSAEEIISSMDEAVVVEKFAFPTVNPYTGAFALETRLAHVVRNGSIEGQIKHALIVGNIYDGLKNVLEIANDTRTVGDMVVPSVVFEGFEAVGSK
ncbi:MAG: TldD/PmbA family protein [Methanomassiliicoccus sp.]|nr:TldD/PmbA family protein [Methanomassiliicoccus sp.]